MIKEVLTYCNICRQVADVDCSQHFNRKWPTSFGNLACSKDAVTAAQVHALIRHCTGSRTTNGTKKMGTCHNFGNKDHRARECNEQKNKDSKAPRRNSCYVQYSSTSKHITTSNSNGCREKAPYACKPSIKVIQGRPWHWCPKCDRWSTNYGTDGRTGSRSYDAPSGNTMCVNPSAWYTVNSLVEDCMF